ncbi:hypothetical protein M441DRAFT_63176 [Trichoderma asperellum CBS 433.97]|uniref:Ketoreductase (KR) domain-containing protein n=1 Tax=Trichoderma asperellum (strain ATCC 204424 / CBS 433.97 / NBRC 101777) TaxID=1042311 RepID=A0A2T3YQG4_TRIA4|nr:hypothetical protein M441DRAFT_63176 [Trichoderma asperellum CBS 433.97]PTB34811.1 hypothetical protein M441DRAFT_63176 [Trichoderma asperellum CBS 433.97]
MVRLKIALEKKSVQQLPNLSPSLLILAGRNAKKLEFTTNAIAKVNPQAATKTLNLNLQCPLADKEAANIVHSQDGVPHIDVFCHNAAIMGPAYGNIMD